MRASQYLLATVKETPSDAETASHQLMIRAGLIRKLATGLYTWLPLGLRVLRKVTEIVREEMDKAGAMEVSMAVKTVCGVRGWLGWEAVATECGCMWWIWQCWWVREWLEGDGGLVEAVAFLRE